VFDKFADLELDIFSKLDKIFNQILSHSNFELKKESYMIINSTKNIHKATAWGGAFRRYASVHAAYSLGVVYQEDKIP